MPGHGGTSLLRKQRRRDAAKNRRRVSRARVRFSHDGLGFLGIEAAELVFEISSQRGIGRIMSGRIERTVARRAERAELELNPGSPDLRWVSATEKTSGVESRRPLGLWPRSSTS